MDCDSLCISDHSVKCMKTAGSYTQFRGRFLWRAGMGRITTG